MKTSIKKFALLSLTASFVLFTSCKKDDSNDPETINYSVENTARTAQIDNITEGSQNIAESAYVKIEEPSQSTTSIFTSTCPVFEISGGGSGSGTITVNFGTECELHNQAIVSGKIILNYSAISAGIRNIDYEYENFTYNGNGVSGGGTITRDISTNVPKSIIDEDITIAFAESTLTGTRSGLRIVEWVEGFGSGTWTDNVFEIEGNWQTNLSNGFTRTGEVTQTLVRKASCRYLVKGKIEVTQEGLTGVLDFGNGNCDPNATITFNGQEFPVILGN